MPPIDNTTYTKAELESLTPEELSAIEAETGDEDALQALADGGSDDDGDAGKGATEDGDGKADADDKPGGEAAGDADDVPAAEDKAAGPDTSIYTADAGDADTQIQTHRDAIKAARSAEKEALKQLNDGEIDFDAYSAIRDEADGKIDAAQSEILDLNNLKTRATVSAEMTTQSQLKAWKGMVDGYFKEAAGSGMAYGEDDAGKALRGELSTLIKAFATEAEAKGLSDANSMEASAWALQQASAVMAMRHGKPVTKPAAGAPAASPAAPAAQRHNLTTLTNLPAAAANVTGDDAMAKFGTLEGDELEQYMAGLPKSEVERLMANS